MTVKRRFWSDEEKRSICLQASAPGVSVAQVAQRYSMNANLIFKWLRDARFAPEVEAHREAVFLPVEISHVLTDEPIAPDAVSPVGGLVRIELAGGHRIIAEGGFDPSALGRLLKAWLS
ncbi:MAG: transposase [Proteobacteria bacterium]|nr:transposase [Pseudomonadota bacterium]